MTEKEHTQTSEIKRSIEWELSKSGIGQAILGIAKGFNRLVKWLTSGG